MERALEGLRTRIASAMRRGPPLQRRPEPAGGEVVERWVAACLSPEEQQLVLRLERLYGELALAELFADALVEAGVTSPERPVQ